MIIIRLTVKYIINYISLLMQYYFGLRCWMCKDIVLRVCHSTSLSASLPLKGEESTPLRNYVMKKGQDSSNVHNLSMLYIYTLTVLPAASTASYPHFLPETYRKRRRIIEG